MGCFGPAGGADRSNATLGQANIAMDAHGPGRSLSALNADAFARPLSPQQDPRLARSVQKRFAHVSSPSLGCPPAMMGHMQSQPAPARGSFSRSPSPTHGTVIMH